MVEDLSALQVQQVEAFRAKTQSQLNASYYSSQAAPSVKVNNSCNSEDLRGVQKAIDDREKEIERLRARKFEKEAKKQ